jgi:hypothetical protein
VMDHGSSIASGIPQAIRGDPRVLDAYLGGSDDDLDDSATADEPEVGRGAAGS